MSRWTHAHEERRGMALWDIKVLFSLAVAAIGLLLPFPYTENAIMIIAIIVIAVVLLAGYLLPTIIAAYRHHPNVVAIFLLNLFLGWSVLGWVGALVWSVISLTTRERIIYVEHRQP